MNARAFFIVLLLLLLPSTSWAQGVPAFKERQDLLDFYRQFFIQNLGRMQELDVFKDGTVLHGFIKVGGTSTNTHTDLIGLAQNLTTTVRTFFAIPNDYQFVVLQGGFMELKPIETIDARKRVKMVLTIDGVPLENAFVQIMVDEQGHLRTLTISVPRLRPEIVTSVRGTLLTASQAQGRIQTDANALPAGNLFNIKPNTPLTFVDFRKVAVAREPYVLYLARVNRAEYTVNAKTGAVTKVSSMN